jgi:hypothetical protein
VIEAWVSLKREAAAVGPAASVGKPEAWVIDNVNPSVTTILLKSRAMSVFLSL